MDDIDRTLIGLLMEDATQSYATLGKAVGLSGGAAHERVRKLRERGVIRRTTIEVDQAALGRTVSAYVLVDGGSWMGDSADLLAAIPAVEEAHVIAGPASLLLKVRTSSTKELQDVLRQVFEVHGVTGTQTVVVLETFFERTLK
ncbi:Lrp/AsnC family transcriptional regulator [Nonomuraea spiralis]|uniref:Lrp/AsnC family transcriptional regulator n=1 Tax=Nonomuraea spiralis TaxID=46182 RepID=A0ABV5ICU4_9ACTN|nr:MULTISPECIES: Lrp/AsnC family transcriptional regulator [Nonomuraea]RSN03540.1 AsnC family transcriptional regulator [Nonomuraea sp. WAC 01424]GGS80577.1 transcriptional regulator [Nonomuraea spiralis]